MEPAEAWVALSKTKSKFNGLIDVELSGFTPNAPVTLRWADGTILATPTADGAGGASAVFRTPLVALGTYRVEARDAHNRVAATRLSVIPRIMLNEVEGPTSTRLRVYFYGFAPGERVEVRWYTTDESKFIVIKTVTIAANGRGSNIVTIPARTGVGTHKVMGRVIGVARSASTPFRVTAGSAAAAVIGEATATPTMTSTPTPATVATPVVTPTPTETPSTTPTPTREPADEPTPLPSVVPTPEPAPVVEATPTPTPEPEPAPVAEPTPETPTAVVTPMPEEEPAG